MTAGRAEQSSHPCTNKQLRLGNLGSPRLELGPTHGQTRYQKIENTNPPPNIANYAKNIDFLTHNCLASSFWTHFCPFSFYFGTGKKQKSVTVQPSLIKPIRIPIQWRSLRTVWEGLVAPPPPHLGGGTTALRKENFFRRRASRRKILA